MRLLPSVVTNNDTKTKVASQQLRFKLAQLIVTSESMLAFATAQDWQKVEELEFSRRREISEINEFDYEVQLASDISEAYETLLEINDQISSLVASGKSQIYKDFNAGQQVVSGIKHYSNIY